MRIRIGCTDGHTYESDHNDESVLQAEIDKADGHVFEGERVANVPEAMEQVMKYYKHDTRNCTQVASFFINGVERTFNVNHIVWYEYELDGDEGQDAE